jgi:uncharacterized membrane protein
VQFVRLSLAARLNGMKLPLCNRRQDRAPKIGRLVFPVCWRCLGISIGCIAPGALGSFNMSMLTCILYAFPCLVDASAQYGFRIESTNFRRATTGFLCGLGLTGALTLLMQ